MTRETATLRKSCLLDRTPVLVTGSDASTTPRQFLDRLREQDETCEPLVHREAGTRPDMSSILSYTLDWTPPTVLWRLTPVGALTTVVTELTWERTVLSDNHCGCASTHKRRCLEVSLISPRLSLSPHLTDISHAVVLCNKSQQ